MERNLLWIGYVMQLDALRIEVELEHGREFDEVCDARGGLEATANEQYPLILVNDVVPAGDLVLPEQISVDDVVGIGCHVIKQIRSEGQNRITPIMVTHIGHFVGYDPKTAIRMYQEAGATECFNCYSTSLSDFAKAVGKYF